MAKGREFPLVPSFKSTAAFKRHLATLPIPMSCDDVVSPPGQSPLGTPIVVAGRKVGNRFAAQPLEGWDGTPDGKPTEQTLRRWSNFGRSGAKLIWGGEAVSVRADGRGNPHGLYFCEENRQELERLLHAVKDIHENLYGTTEDLLVGLQLTHSGRRSKPDSDGVPKPRVASRHPLLDAQVGIQDDSPVFTDLELSGLIEDFVITAKAAYEAGFDFVDVKACHGYLLHEFLGAHNRPGTYGGSFENRTRLLREILAGVRREAPDLLLGVRLSAFDVPPFALDERAMHGTGKAAPVAHPLPYPFAFGANPEHPTEIDLSEPVELLRMCRDLGVCLVNITGPSSYTAWHLTRPSLYPTLGAYPTPEDPLIGCARLFDVAAACKRAVPEMFYVGTGYSYLQEFLPHVAQAQVREGTVDFVGLGRLMLSYPEVPADILSGKVLERKRICRTFNDCLSAPRQAMISGCYALDPYYKARPEAQQLKDLKRPSSAGA